GQYTLLSAAGGITGTFGQVTTQGSFNGLIADLEYTSNDVLLTLAALAPGDAMWSATPDTVTFGNRSDYHTPGNWTDGAVPTATAVFGATAGANIFFNNPVGSPPITIGRFQFNPDAP